MHFFSANTESSSSGPYVGVIGGLVAVIIILIITIVTLLCKRNEGSMLIPLMWTPIGNVMVSVLASSANDRGFESESGQIKDYEICICCFFTKYVALLRKRKEQMWQMATNYVTNTWRSDFFQHTLSTIFVVFCSFIFYCFLFLFLFFFLRPQEEYDSM